MQQYYSDSPTVMKSLELKKSTKVLVTVVMEIQTPTMVDEVY